jgi:hypothetical protein
MTDETQAAQVKAPPTKLYAAMAKARSQMKAPKLDGTNPHFKSRYVTLAGLIDACMPALSSNGIHIWQAPTDEHLLTIITHESGESVEYRSKMPVAKDIQQHGSILTYMRRYVLSSILSIAGDIDDDAESTMARDKKRAIPKVPATSQKQAPTATRPPTRGYRVHGDNDKL